MALPDLAVVADLSARKIDTTDASLVSTLLAVASATIRRAAGSPIKQTTSTVSLWVTDGDPYLNLPGQPVTAVASVSMDGDAVTNHKLVHGRLWRSSGWGYSLEPTEIVVTLTHGLPEVPADVVDLACSLVGAGLAASEEGYETHGGKVAEMVGDYQVTYARGAEAVATAMALPASTRHWLKSRFGGGVGMVSYL